MAIVKHLYGGSGENIYGGGGVVLTELPPSSNRPLLGWPPRYTAPQLTGPANEVSPLETPKMFVELNWERDGGGYLECWLMILLHYESGPINVIDNHDAGN